MLPGSGLSLADTRSRSGLWREVAWELGTVLCKGSRSNKLEELVVILNECVALATGTGGDHVL